jgi:hypothetical protein
MVRAKGLLVFEETLSTYLTTRPVSMPKLAAKMVDFAQRRRSYRRGIE